jgi:hypothetical protein
VSTSLFTAFSAESHYLDWGKNVMWLENEITNFTHTHTHTHTQTHTNTHIHIHIHIHTQCDSEYDSDRTKNGYLFFTAS